MPIAPLLGVDGLGGRVLPITIGTMAVGITDGTKVGRIITVQFKSIQDTPPVIYPAITKAIATVAPPQLGA